jgi:hypothetical protein
MEFIGGRNCYNDERRGRYGFAKGAKGAVPVLVFNFVPFAFGFFADFPFQ